MRGQSCHTQPCIRIHVSLDDYEYNIKVAAMASNSSPSSAPSQETSAQEVLRRIVEAIINETPQHEKRAKVMRLLTKFHPDKVQEPPLIQFFKPIAEFLTSQLQV
jgi:hypothetical protein